MADSTRRDVIFWKKGKDDKQFAVRLGTAVEGKKEGVTNVYLDAIPPTVDGQYKFSIVPQREKPQGAPPGQAPGMPDDEIPFAPEFR